MSIMNSHWTQFKRHFGEWRNRVREREELRRLDTASLHDLGVSQCTADFEASKRFWVT